MLRMPRKCLLLSTNYSARCRISKIGRPGSTQTATGNRDSYPPARQSARRRRMAVAVNECGPRLEGPPLLALNHVVQVSTLRGRACMNVADCILANEQLVMIRITREAWGMVRRKV